MMPRYDGNYAAWYAEREWERLEALGPEDEDILEEDDPDPEVIEEETDDRIGEDRNDGPKINEDDPNIDR